MYNDINNLVNLLIWCTENMMDTSNYLNSLRKIKNVKKEQVSVVKDQNLTS